MYWNTYDPANEAPSISFDMNCPTGMIAISAGAKNNQDALHVYPNDPLITDHTNASGSLKQPVTSWRIQLPGGQFFTSPVIGYIVCGKVN